MSRRKSLKSRDRRSRIFIASLVMVILTASAWAVVSIATAWAASAKAVNLDAPVPPPEDVFIQKRNNSDGLGNTYVFVKLSSKQVQAKAAEGTADFLTLGTPDALVVLRDDGRGGDPTAGDGLYTGIATTDSADLARRSEEDIDAFSRSAEKLIPDFEGRTAIGVKEPEPFDHAAFEGGQIVRLGPAVAFLKPEGPSRSTEALHSAGSSQRNVTARISSSTPVTPGTNSFQDRVLMIVNPDVIADPDYTWDPCTGTGTANGAWTFNHLMTEMANPAASGIDPSAFVRQWLDTWLDPAVTINEDPVPPRARMNAILEQWPRIPGTKRLDLSKSPLRLLAIAPRIDVRLTSGGGGPYSTNASGNFLDAGEARFIFGFVAKRTEKFDPEEEFISPAEIPGTNGCFALPFTVIFEYRIAKCKCEDVRSWAQQWVALDGMIPGTDPYNGHLVKLTEQFVTANANPRNPNGSSLGQLRTNEVALNGPWELREFQLTQFPFSFLQETTVDDTIRNDPGSDFNNDANTTGRLRDWIENVIKPILAANGHEATIPRVPLFFRSATFLAGDSRTNEANPDFITFHWSDPNLDVVNDLDENWARHRVSRAACNGCHRRDTFTHFTHVNPDDTIILSIWNDVTNNWNPTPPLRANPALPAELSVFLTGINNLGDPANAVATGQNVRSPNQGSPGRNFDDLARRELDIQEVAGMTCSRLHQANAALVRKSLATSGVLPDNLFEGMQILPPGQQVSVAIDDMKRNVIREVH